MLKHADIPLYGGLSLSRPEREGEKSVMIQGLIPGETAKVEVVEEHKNYTVAEITEVKTPSPHRISPRCPVYNRCGGCSYQHIAYPFQLRMKEEIVSDQFRRTAKLTPALTSTLYDAPFEYRNRVQLKVDDKGRTGFYKPSSHDLVPLDNYPLLAPSLNEVLFSLSQKPPLPVSVKEVHLLTNPQGEVAVNIRLRKSLKHPKHLPPELKGVIDELYNREDILFILVDGKRVTAKKKILLYSFPSEGEPLLYRSSPEVFHQVNTRLNNKLLTFVQQVVREKKPQVVVDLYAGSGNLSFAVAHLVQRVIAIEENKRAEKYFLWNMKNNKIKNAQFLSGKAEKTPLPQCDMVLLDPPRAGAGRKVCNALVQSGASYILSLSCNPSTHARDILFLQDCYDLETLQVTDFFPQTKHIETFALLKRKS